MLPSAPCPCRSASPSPGPIISVPCKPCNSVALSLSLTTEKLCWMLDTHCRVGTVVEPECDLK